MNGTDFYELAIDLSARRTPTAMRSATSRAYYGAFHKALQTLERLGIALPKGPECHTKLRFLFDQSSDAEVVLLNAKLSSLRSSRNEADYDLVRTHSEDQLAVAVNLSVAAEIIAKLDQAFTEGSRSNAAIGITNYARNVLKLPLSGS